MIAANRSVNWEAAEALRNYLTRHKRADLQQIASALSVSISTAARLCTHIGAKRVAGFYYLKPEK